MDSLTFPNVDEVMKVLSRHRRFDGLRERLSEAMTKASESVNDYASVSYEAAVQADTIRGEEIQERIEWDRHRDKVWLDHLEITKEYYKSALELVERQVATMDRIAIALEALVSSDD